MGRAVLYRGPGTPAQHGPRRETALCHAAHSPSQLPKYDFFHARLCHAWTDHLDFHL